MIRHILLISAALQKWKHKAKTWLPRIETTPRTLEVLTQCFVNTYWCNNIHSVIDTELERKQITTDFYLHSMVAHITLPPPALIKKNKTKTTIRTEEKQNQKERLFTKFDCLYTQNVYSFKRINLQVAITIGEKRVIVQFTYYFVKSLIPWLL